MLRFIIRKIKSYLIVNFLRVKSRAYISSDAHILGVKKVFIGENSIISEGCWFNSNARSVKDVSEINIGANTYIGKRNFFSSGYSIKIGDYCMTGCNCSFLSSDHVIDNPMIPYISSGCTVIKNIKIGTNVWLGTNVTILGNVTIGHGSIIGANSLVLDNIPPFSIAIGSPAKVIKRFSFKENCWIKVSEFCEDVIDEDVYLNTIKDNYPRINMPLYASGREYGNI